MQIISIIYIMVIILISLIYGSCSWRWWWWSWTHFCVQMRCISASHFCEQREILSVLPDKFARFLFEFHCHWFESLDLPFLPADRSRFDVHGALLNDKVLQYVILWTLICLLYILYYHTYYIHYIILRINYYTFYTNYAKYEKRERLIAWGYISW